MLLLLRWEDSIIDQTLSLSLEKTDLRARVSLFTLQIKETSHYSVANNSSSKHLKRGTTFTL